MGDLQSGKLPEFAEDGSFTAQHDVAASLVAFYRQRGIMFVVDENIAGMDGEQYSNCTPAAGTTAEMIAKIPDLAKEWSAERRAATREAAGDSAS